MSRIPELPPALQDYDVRGHATVLGVEHTGLAHPASGIRMLIPERSIGLISERPEIGELIGRVASFAAAHDGYSDSRTVSEHEDVDTLLHADLTPDWHHFDYASVYRDRSSQQIIKAYDFSVANEPYAQYAVMSSMAHALKDTPKTRSPKLTASEQYAIISAPISGHKTIVMENVDGISVTKALESSSLRTLQGRDATKKAAGTAKALINRAISEQVPMYLRPFLNDVTRGGIHNVHIQIPDNELTPDDAVAAMQHIKEARIIDQPGTAPTARAYGHLLRVSRLSKLLH